MPCVVDTPARTAPPGTGGQARQQWREVRVSTKNSPRRPPGRAEQLDRSPAPGSALSLSVLQLAEGRGQEEVESRVQGKREQDEASGGGTGTQSCHGVQCLRWGRCGVVTLTHCCRCSRGGARESHSSLQ
jgi:hypothetical protein